MSKTTKDRAHRAIALYSQRHVSLRRAAELSGLTRPEFERHLSAAKVTRDYSVAELDVDLQWALKAV